LSQRHDNLWLLIAGDGPLREEINNLVDTTNGKEKIKLLGQLEDVTPILQASDIYVLSSDNEGLSVALTEAMSVGLVSIASNVSGSNEVLEDEQNGFLVDPSYDGILGGMEKAIHMDPEARRILSGKARQTIIEKFSINYSVKHILELMDIESVEGITA
jgi:glycosyltransferase involved in cell wall biosynthesis